MSYKTKLTRFLLDAAFRFPFLFPKSVQTQAKSLHSKSDFITRLKSKKPKYNEVSLFDSDFYWKAISFTTLVNNDELLRIKKWKEKFSLTVVADRSGQMFDSGSFDSDTGWFEVGLIRVNDETYMDRLNSIYMNSIYLDSVYISLVKYSSGLFAVTLYMCFSDAATGLVKSIKPPKMTEFVKLNNFNFFSRKRFTVSLLLEDVFCRHFIKKNGEKVYDEAWQLFDIIKNEIGIKRNRADVYCVSDMYLDQVAPYFDNGRAGNSEGKLILAPKTRQSADFKFSTNEDESFVFNDNFNINGIDMTYMKICPNSTFSKHDNFKNSYCANIETHLAIVPLLLIVKNIDKVSNEISRLRLYNKKTSMIKLHKSLFSVVHELQLIDGWLKALKKELPYYLLVGYKNESDEIIASQENRVAELQRVTRTFYSLSENRIQISNVRYNQIYSVVVFIFIFIQVFLAAMSIDWGKSNVWYSSIVTWVKNLF
ncbi:hypothetical protein [Serratia fonticola]